MSGAEQNTSEVEALIANQRAKRRLVGAIVLFLILSLLLPFILHDRYAQSPAPPITVIMPESKQGQAIVLPPDHQNTNASANVVSEELSAPSLPDLSPAQNAQKEDPSVEAPAVSGPPLPTNTISSPQAKLYSVQLGVFANSESALSLQQKLKVKGFSATLNSVGNNTRIRVGEFASRDEASVTLRRIKSAGFSEATIVTVNP